MEKEISTVSIRERNYNCELTTLNKAQNKKLKLKNLKVEEDEDSILFDVELGVDLGIELDRE